MLVHVRAKMAGLVTIVRPSIIRTGPLDTWGISFI